LRSSTTTNRFAIRLNTSSSAGFRGKTFVSAESFLQCGELHRFACVIVDIRMSGMSGLELHEQLRASSQPVPTILMTPYADERGRAQALKARVVCCLAKPFVAEELLECLRTALRRHADGTL
jgi:FixJ family two-component response regulator